MSDDFRWLLMTRVHEDGRSGEARTYVAVAVRDVGWALTRAQAEAAADGIKVHSDRFLMPLDEESARRVERAGASPRLSMPPGDSIWHYGEPARVDLVAILRRLADVAEESDRETAALPLDAVLEAAVARFGRADRRAIEARFEPLVLALGGKRREDPPAYLLPIASVLTGVPPSPYDPEG